MDKEILKIKKRFLKAELSFKEQARILKDRLQKVETRIVATQGESGIPISQLPEVATINDDSVIPIVQDNVTSKITFDNLQKTIGGSNGNVYVFEHSVIRVLDCSLLDPKYTAVELTNNVINDTGHTITIRNVARSNIRKVFFRGVNTTREVSSSGHAFPYYAELKIYSLFGPDSQVYSNEIYDYSGSWYIGEVRFPGIEVDNMQFCLEFSLLDNDSIDITKEMRISAMIPFSDQGVFNPLIVFSMQHNTSGIIGLCYENNVNIDGQYDNGAGGPPIAIDDLKYRIYTSPGLRNFNTARIIGLRDEYNALLQASGESQLFFRPYTTQSIVIFFRIYLVV